MGRKRRGGKAADQEYVFTLWVRERASGAAIGVEGMLRNKLGLSSPKNYSVATIPTPNPGSSAPKDGASMRLCVAAPNRYGLRAQIIEGEGEVEDYLRSGEVTGRIFPVLVGDAGETEEESSGD